uniref:Transposase (putative) gypsy type domain-containing protein n=1 Tax=Oryza sativa subsp. japonica TaxID=39947 RepID=Q75H85_ORYSJ|nr:hypothetical protein [Oryza sativa Japonica Group]
MDLGASNTDTAAMKKLLVAGALPGREHLEREKGGTHLEPILGRMVIVEDFVCCSFLPPPSKFLLLVLNFYGLSLLHLNPNSIAFLSIFAHLCEAYVGWCLSLIFFTTTMNSGGWNPTKFPDAVDSISGTGRRQFISPDTLLGKCLQSVVRHEQIAWFGFAVPSRTVATLKRQQRAFHLLLRNYRFSDTTGVRGELGERSGGEELGLAERHRERRRQQRSRRAREARGYTAPSSLAPSSPAVHPPPPIHPVAGFRSCGGGVVVPPGAEERGGFANARGPPGGVTGRRMSSARSRSTAARRLWGGGGSSGVCSHGGGCCRGRGGRHSSAGAGAVEDLAIGVEEEAKSRLVNLYFLAPHHHVPCSHFVEHLVGVTPPVSPRAATQAALPAPRPITPCATCRRRHHPARAAAADAALPRRPCPPPSTPLARAPPLARATPPACTLLPPRPCAAASPPDAASSRAVAA